MVNINSQTEREQRRKVFRRSLLASAVMAVAASSFAQDDTSDDTSILEEEVVVTGMRQSLMNAQDIKRNAPTIVDSITAKDLGSFPDKSIAEALQRVAGITVNRFAATADTAHFSAEPSGVIVRGLQFVRNEFNGRDTFSANSSRGLSWTDVSPELLSGADTYKNQTAELIEGGIAGTVNLRTRVPFDQDGMMVAANVRANYNDLAEEVTPEVSGLFSNRWMTDIGEFGFLANFAYSKVQTRSEGVQQYRINRFRDVYTDTGGPEEAYIPAIINMRDNNYFRDRTGVALAAQWQDTDEKFLLTAQYNRSEYDNAWEEYVVASNPADLSYGQSVFYEIGPFTGADARDNNRPQPAPGTDPFTFNNQGLFQTGTIVTGIGWWGGSTDESRQFARNAEGDAFVTPCYNNADNGWDGNGCEPPLRGIEVATGTRSSNQTNMTQDFGLNFKWDVTDSIRANFDAQWVDSEVDNYDIEVGYKSLAAVNMDLTGDRARMEWVGPGPNVNLSPGLNGNPENYWNNPSNYWLNYIMDHVEDSDGEQLAFRTDWEFDVNKGGVESVKIGARYADRDQTVRWSSYNWQNVSNTWTGDQYYYFNLDRHDPAPAGAAGAQAGFTGYPQGHYEVREFSGDWWGLDSEYVFADMDLLQDQQRMASTMGAAALGLTGGVGWDPICSNMGDRSGETPGTCFTPAELADVSEQTTAAYIQINFGDNMHIGSVPVSGNIGVRWVQTEVTSTGGISFPRLGDEYYFTWQYADLQDENGDPVINPDTGNPYQTVERTPDPTRTTLGCAPNVETPEGAPAIPNTVGCYLDPEDVAFMQGQNVLDVSTTTHNNLLPSLNIKFDLTDEWLFRISLARAMSRPDMGNLRNYLGISGTLPDANDPDDPLWEKDGSGNIVGASVYYNGGAQNPFLKPVIADGLDLSLEYYFSDVGSFTLTAFGKKFKDYIQTGRYYRTETVDGVSRQIEVQGPLNGDGAELTGFEIAFQRFFDFLPEPFDGLGIQANYTYIDNKGIENQNLSNVTAAGSNVTSQAPDAVQVGGLESLSKEGYNFVTMYEKGDVQARLAYSWRSEYVVTVIDCCVAYPVINDDTGQLDGSIQYDINDNFSVSFSVSNILNEETKTYQQIQDKDEGGLKFPTGNFQNDRRFALGVSWRY